MSIFFPFYEHIKDKIPILDTLVTPTYSLPQQEIIPIGSNVYLHMTYQELVKLPPEYDYLTGDFILYQNESENINSIIICIHDETLTTETSRIYEFLVKAGGRIAKYKDMLYIKDKITSRKLKNYNNKGKHPIIGYGKFKLDNKNQYNLYGYRLKNKNIINEPVQSTPFKMTFITNRSSEYHTKYSIERTHVDITVL